LGPDDIPAWADALRRCAEDRSLLAKLRHGIRSPRSMGAVAGEMAQLYSRHFDPAKRGNEMASVVQ